jgi:hypothetical protein
MSNVTKDMSIAELMKGLANGNSIRFDSRCLERTARFLIVGGGHLTCELAINPMGVILSPLRNKDQKDLEISKLAAEVDDLESRLSASVALVADLQKRARLGFDVVLCEDEVVMASDDIHGDVVHREDKVGQDQSCIAEAKAAHDAKGSLVLADEAPGYKAASESDAPFGTVVSDEHEMIAAEVETVETTFGMGITQMDDIPPTAPDTSVMSAEEQDEIGMAGDLDEYISPPVDPKPAGKITPARKNHLAGTRTTRSPDTEE